MFKSERRFEKNMNQPNQPHHKMSLSALTISGLALEAPNASLLRRFSDVLGLPAEAAPRTNNERIERQTEPSKDAQVRRESQQ